MGRANVGNQPERLRQNIYSGEDDEGRKREMLRMIELAITIIRFRLNESTNVNVWRCSS